MFPAWIKLIEGFHLSFEIGLKKPSREYFELAVKRFLLDPKTCVFLDDGLDNILGAEALGIRAHKVGGRGLFADELRSWGLM
jgi:HAD superfamily hydrolase (TIGR01509 family)